MCLTKMAHMSLSPELPGVQRYGPAHHREMVPWKAGGGEGRTADSRAAAVRVLPGDRSAGRFLPGQRE